MFILYIASRYSHFNILFSKPCQRQYELLPSLGVHRLSSVYFSHFNLLHLKTLSQMNWNWVGSIYGWSSLKSTHFVMIHYQTWPPQAILVSDWLIFKNLLLWNRLAKWTETWEESSMECPLWRWLILFWSVNKHGHHMQFLFLIGRFKKTSSPLKPLGQMNWNLVGSIYGRSSIKIAHFVLIH